MLPAGYLVKLFLKALIRFDMRLAHFIQYRRRAMLRRNLKLTGYVIFYKLVYKLVALVLHKIIITYAGADEHLFHARNSSQLAQDVKIFGVVNLQIRTRLWSQALSALAQALLQLLLAGGHPEISRGTTYVVNISLKSRELG